MDRVLKKVNFPEIEYQIKENANPEYGELYTNIPFMLSKSLKKKSNGCCKCNSGRINF